MKTPRTVLTIVLKIFLFAVSPPEPSQFLIPSGQVSRILLAVHTFYWTALLQSLKEGWCTTRGFLVCCFQNLVTSSGLAPLSRTYASRGLNNLLGIAFTSLSSRLVPAAVPLSGSQEEIRKRLSGNDTSMVDQRIAAKNLVLYGPGLFHWFHKAWTMEWQAFKTSCSLDFGVWTRFPRDSRFHTFFFIGSLEVFCNKL